ncbi:MAG: hypothetical protein EU548_03325 [Promethearchaeota archaeon]|nr:MAG: hypothetical protein EU548_03325 [Candidatus Lokiarchaeota archaeon]
MNNSIGSIETSSDKLQITLDFIEGAIISGDYAEALRMAQNALSKAEEQHWVDIFEGVIKRVKTFQRESFDRREMRPNLEKPKVITESPDKVIESDSHPQLSFEERIDNLTELSGVGPKMAEKLQNAGYTSYSQIARVSPEHLSAVKGVGVPTAVKIIASAKEKTSNLTTSVPELKELQTNSFNGSHCKSQATKSDSITKQKESLIKKYNPLYDNAKGLVNKGKTELSEKASPTTPDVLENEADNFRAEVKRQSRAKSEEHIEKEVDVEEKTTKLFDAEGEKEKRAKTHMKEMLIDSISEIFRDHNYSLLQEKLYIQGIDGIACKLCINSPSRQILILIPYKFFSATNKIIVSEKKMEIAGLESELLSTRLDVPLLNADEILSKKVRTTPKIINALSRVLQEEISIQTTKLCIEPLLLTEIPPGFTEKSILFAYQRHSNLHIISKSDLSSFLEFLERKLYYIDSYSRSSQRKIKLGTSKRLFTRNIKRLSYPVLSVGAFLTFIIATGWYDILKYFIVVGYATFSLYLGGLIFLVRYHRKKESAQLNQNRNNYHSKDIDFEEGDLALIYEELDLEQMAQFSYECYGKKIPNKIVENLEKMQIHRMTMLSKQSPRYDSARIVRKNKDRAHKIVNENLSNTKIREPFKRDKREEVDSKRGVKDAKEATTKMMTLRSPNNEKEDEIDLVKKYSTFLND